MILKMILDEILPKLPGVLIQEYGDDLEKAFFPSIQNFFPNFEKLWQFLVVPSTYRIYFLSKIVVNPCIRRTRQQVEYSSCNPFLADYDWKAFEKSEARKPSIIDTRPEVGKRIKDLGLLHYSILLQLENAKNHILAKNKDFLEDSLVHLAGIMDLIEDFATSLHLLLCDSDNRKVEILQELTEVEFLERAKKWYHEFYPKTFEFYLSKGKFRSISVPNRSNIVHEFFQENPMWNNVEKFFVKVKTYRNKIVHTPFLLKIKAGNDFFVPKLGRILDYQNYDSIRNIAENQNIFERDFLPKEQLVDDLFNEALKHLDSIWPLFFNEISKRLEKSNTVFLKEMGFNETV